MTPPLDSLDLLIIFGAIVAFIVFVGAMLAATTIMWETNASSADGRQSEGQNQISTVDMIKYVLKCRRKNWGWSVRYDGMWFWEIF